MPLTTLRGSCFALLFSRLLRLSAVARARVKQGERRNLDLISFRASSSYWLCDRCNSCWWNGWSSKNVATVRHVIWGRRGRPPVGISGQLSSHDYRSPASFLGGSGVALTDDDGSTENMSSMQTACAKIADACRHCLYAQSHSDCAIQRFQFSWRTTHPTRGCRLKVAARTQRR